MLIMTETAITVQLVETITYSKTYEIPELEEVLGEDLEGMTLVEIASHVKKDAKIEEDLQNNAAVWEGKWTAAPGRELPRPTRGIALVTDDGSNAQVMVVDSMQEVYEILRTNFLDPSETVADADLVDEITRQGVVIYIGS